MPATGRFAAPSVFGAHPGTTTFALRTVLTHRESDGRSTRNDEESGGMTRRIAYSTFGCRLNQYDTEAIRTLVNAGGGFETVGPRDVADVHVVNTCSVTARADATARKAIRRINAAQPDAKIVVTGCYAQRAPGELAALPGVALVVGAADRGRFAELIEHLDDGPPVVAVSPIATAKSFLDVPITEMTEHSRAFVKVQEGCNESCTFCIIPQTRGVSRSRTPESVVDQVRNLVDAGYVEVVLTGVHIGDYGLDLPGRRRMLPDLIERILGVDGVERFRLSSIEPASLCEEVVTLMAESSKFARHFHIPFQSGSDAVLARMKRRYRSGEFADLVARIVERVPDCGIGADVICGFPGETDEDFLRTFEHVERLPITYLHAFTYSSRPGSEAEKFQRPGSGGDAENGVPVRSSVSRPRSSAASPSVTWGRVVDVLLEPARRGGAPRIGGWTDNYLRVDMGEGIAEPRIEPVEITGTDGGGLTGVRLPEQVSGSCLFAGHRGATPSEAAPPTDETCTAPLPGASLPGVTSLSQPRTSTQETGFENLAQLCRSTRLKTSGSG